MTQYSAEEILLLSKREKNANKRIRLLAVAQFIECQNRAQVSRPLKVSRRSVNDWVNNYLTSGLAGLEDKPRQGRTSLLTQQQKEQLTRYIHQESQSGSGGRLTGEMINQYIIKHFGIHYHHNYIYTLLKTLGFSWITSRSKHPKQSPQAQEEFKKNRNKNDHGDPGDDRASTS